MSYSGQVQGISKVATGTASAFARSIKGKLTIDAKPIEEYGAGGQAVVGKGTLEASLDISDAIGVAKADAAKWFPTTAGVQVGSFPDFVVTTGGQQWTLEDGQPGGATISMSAGDGLLKGSFAVKFATVTPAAATIAHAYATAAGDTNNTIVVQLGAADIGCLSFEIGNGLDAPPMVNPMDTKVAGSLSLPKGYQIAAKLPTVTAVLEAELATTQLFADSWTPDDLVIDCAEFGTITVKDVVHASFEGEVEDGSGVVGYSYKFQLGSGTVYNRVQFA